MAAFHSDHTLQLATSRLKPCTHIGQDIHSCAGEQQNSQSGTEVTAVPINECGFWEWPQPAGKGFLTLPEVDLDNFKMIMSLEPTSPRQTYSGILHFSILCFCFHIPLIFYISRLFYHYGSVFHIPFISRASNASRSRERKGKGQNGSKHEMGVKRKCETKNRLQSGTFSAGENVPDCNFLGFAVAKFPEKLRINTGTDSTP